MNSKINLLFVLALISMLVGACNFSIPTNVPIPTGLPEIPTGMPQIDTPGIPPPQDGGGGTPAPMPIPVTGTDSPLLFYAFLALLAVVVLVALLAFFRRSDKSGEEKNQR